MAVTENGGKRSLKLAVLYPQEMNMYGDRGNTLALYNRAQAHGYQLEIVAANIAQPLPAVDIYIGGGGQDSGQLQVVADLAAKAEKLRKLADDGCPMLLICGLYQLFGHSFITATGATLPGIGILDVQTVSGSERMIGNIVLESEEFGEIIGYENHAGNTTLGPGATPLGKVVQGAGNNPHDGIEGARYKNIIGTYLHGALLPKNPAVTDFLLRTAAIRKYGDFQPLAGIDQVVLNARKVAKSRPR